MAAKPKKFKIWICTKCDYRYDSPLLMTAAEHNCPKAKRVVGLKGISLSIKGDSD